MTLLVTLNSVLSVLRRTRYVVIVEKLNISRIVTDEVTPLERYVNLTVHVDWVS